MPGSLIAPAAPISFSLSLTWVTTQTAAMSALSQQQRAKGDAFLKEAEATLKKSTWFASSTERKYEDAAETFQKAANAYKVGGWNEEAGNAYKRAANLHKDQLKNLGEASKCLSDAGEWNIIAVFLSLPPFHSFFLQMF